MNVNDEKELVKKASLRVGDIIPFKGEPHVCIRISKAAWEELAGCSSKEYRDLYVSAELGRIFIQPAVVEEFGPSDIITITKEEAALQHPAGGVMTLVSLYTVVKATREEEEKTDGILPDSTDVLA